MDIGAWLGIAALIVTGGTLIASAIAQFGNASRDSVDALTSRVGIMRTEITELRDQLAAAMSAAIACETRCHTLAAANTELSARLLAHLAEKTTHN